MAVYIYWSVFLIKYHSLFLIYQMVTVSLHLFTWLIRACFCSTSRCPAECRVWGARATKCTYRRAPPTRPGRRWPHRRWPSRPPLTGCRCCRRTTRSTGMTRPTCHTPAKAHLHCHVDEFWEHTILTICCRLRQKANGKCENALSELNHWKEFYTPYLSHSMWVSITDKDRDTRSPILWLLFLPLIRWHCRPSWSLDRWSWRGIRPPWAWETPPAPRPIHVIKFWVKLTFMRKIWVEFHTFLMRQESKQTSLGLPANESVTHLWWRKAESGKWAVIWSLKSQLTLCTRGQWGLSTRRGGHSGQNPVSSCGE